MAVDSLPSTLIDPMVNCTRQFMPNYFQGRRLRGDIGVRPLQNFRWRGRICLCPTKFQKYLIKYEFLQCVPLFVLAPAVYCMYNSKGAILRCKLPIISFLFVQTLKILTFKLN